MKSATRSVTATCLLATLAGCASTTPMPTVQRVDLERFMGDWYVIASIPTSIEKGAHNAVESYRLEEDGTIATTFTFSKGSFDGPRKEYRPRGFVRDQATNATWGMQFVWPVKAEYLIIDLDEAYSRTVIGRSRRDYVWIMAREPRMAEEDYRAIIGRLEGLGYDVSRIQKVPQRW